MATTASTVDLSVIIPVGSRHDDMGEILDAYTAGLDAMGLSYEIIVVLDGDRPGVLEAMSDRQKRHSNVHVARLARPFGEATAVSAGFGISRGATILSLPAYLQVDPSEFPRLLEEKGDHHMVVCRRWPRHGTPFDKMRRAVFHRILSWVTGQRFRDLGCGVRLFDREILDEIALYGDQHRFFPLIVERNGFRVIEIDARQSDKDRFRGRYGIREYLRRFLDIFTVFFLARFTKKPLRFFGTIGAIVFVVGAIDLTYIVIERLFFNQSLADRPALLLSSLLVVLGIQIGALGLLGELIIFTHARSIKEYRVERVVNPGSTEAVPEQSPETLSGTG